MAVDRRETQEVREGEAEATPVVRTLTLNHGEHQDATLYR